MHDHIEAIFNSVQMIHLFFPTSIVQLSLLRAGADSKVCSAEVIDIEITEDHGLTLPALSSFVPLAETASWLGHVSFLVNKLA
ncbi:Hypothetical predicted protein [Olea europaea subsp. europaea]|uniref:Uncharacterized protein n=1 Tax=Olea europaea subsp. europaea TaxID=158383 RepID=A0A8S0UPI7_OLEEU|nr:Hypothetical predicted protein [Olea europaea subsp. europaea]